MRILFKRIKAYFKVPHGHLYMGGTNATEPIATVWSNRIYISQLCCEPNRLSAFNHSEAASYRLIVLANLAKKYNFNVVSVILTVIFYHNFGIEARKSFE